MTSHTAHDYLQGTTFFKNTPRNSYIGNIYNIILLFLKLRVLVCYTASKPFSTNGSGDTGDTRLGVLCRVYSVVEFKKSR